MRRMPRLLPVPKPRKKPDVQRMIRLAEELADELRDSDGFWVLATPPDGDPRNALCLAITTKPELVPQLDQNARAVFGTLPDARSYDVTRGADGVFRKDPPPEVV